MKRVAAMPLIIRIEKGSPPARTDALEAAAIVALEIWRSLPTRDDVSSEVMAEWIVEPRKIVRRARGASWLRATTYESSIKVSRGTADMVGLPIAWTDTLPPEISRLPVTGTELEDSIVPIQPPVSAAVLWLSPVVSMSTGKEMAQAGHGGVLLWETMRENARIRWQEAGQPLAVRTATPGKWDRLLQSDMPRVTDGGHTEVAPGTVTLVVEEPHRTLISSASR